MVGATTFPRHWVYDDAGDVVSKSATISFEEWYERGPGTKATPWGDEDSPVFTTMAETALERELSATLMQHGRPDVRELAEGTVLTQQGDEADELFVILDGMVSVEVDGRDLGDLGPGAVVGERALLEGGRRTATLRAAHARVRVAAASASAVSLHALQQLTTQHHREDADARRRRREATVLLPLVGAVLVAGCRLELDVNVEVAEDGSGSVEVVVGIDRDGIERIGGDLDAVLAIDDLDDAGWTRRGARRGGRRLHARAVPQALRRPGGGRRRSSTRSPARTGRSRTSRCPTTLRSRRTEWGFTGRIDFSGGLEAFGDEELAAELDGEPLGQTVEEIEAQLGEPLEPGDPGRRRGAAARRGGVERHEPGGRTAACGRSAFGDGPVDMEATGEERAPPASSGWAWRRPAPSCSSSTGWCAWRSGPDRQASERSRRRRWSVMSTDELDLGAAGAGPVVLRRPSTCRRR